MITDMLGFGRTSIYENYECNPEVEAITMESVEDITGDPFEFAIATVYENELNFERIEKMMILDEYAYLLENGQEMVFEAGKLKGFFEAAKKAILSIWHKITQFFKAAASKIADIFKNNEKFATKYKPIFDKEGLYGKKVPLSNEVKTYSSVTYIYKLASDCMSNAVKMAGDLTVSSDISQDSDIMKGIIKTITGTDTDSINSYFKKKVESTTRTLEVSADYFTELTNSNDVKTKLKNLYDANRKAINKTIDSLKKAEKDIDKKNNKDDASKAHNVVKYAKRIAGVLPHINSAAVKRINARLSFDRQSVSAVIKYYGSKIAKTGKVEEATSFIEAVEIL